MTRTCIALMKRFIVCENEMRLHNKQDWMKQIKNKRKRRNKKIEIIEYIICWC